MNLPTPEQTKEFIQHLWNVHSWYKHISLLEGGKFVVFLHEDAGMNYPSMHPALKYSNDVEGYRKQFGHLDYARDLGSGHYYRDGGGNGAMTLKDLQDIPIREEFILYPYVHSEMYWHFFEDDYARLSKNHPHAQYLRQIWALEQRIGTLRGHLSYNEQRKCSAIVHKDVPYEDFFTPEHPFASQYIQAKQDQLRDWKKITHDERKKVQKHVHRLVRRLTL